MASAPGLSMTMKFDNTLGALLLGGMFAMALWGITCVQTYTYFTRPRKDRRIVQTLIAFLWALDTFDSSLNIHFIYHYTVVNYLKPMALMVPVWSVIIHVFVTAFSNFAIRAMFAQRIYRLSKGSMVLTGWIILISLGDLVTGTIITAKAFQLKTYLELDTLSNLMYITFAFGTGSDLSVALALCWLLRRSRTGFKKTDSLIRVLVMYTVNTGLIVALDAAAGMIAYIVMPNNFIFLGFYLLLSKLYLNSYLATMNARHDMRDKMREPVSIHLSDISQSYVRRYDLESVPGSAISEKASNPGTNSNSGVAVSIQTLVHKHEESRVVPPPGPYDQTTTFDSRTGHAV